MRYYLDPSSDLPERVARTWGELPAQWELLIAGEDGGMVLDTVSTSIAPQIERFVSENAPAWNPDLHPELNLSEIDDLDLNREHDIDKAHIEAAIDEVERRTCERAEAEIPATAAWERYETREGEIYREEKAAVFAQQGISEGALAAWEYERDAAAERQRAAQIEADLDAAPF